MEDSKMEIDPNNSDFVALLLRNNIYTDKILAPIREITVNGVDANIESGSNETVQVKITYESGSYTWSCRDNGLGLSENDVRNIFGKIGASNKRHCNKQAGMFGLGSFSPFAVGDTYHVTSHHNGLKSIYCATLVAGDQAINVGRLYKVSEEPTTETGIEVSFDITKDYWKFHDKTKTFINNFLPETNVQYEDHNGEVHTPLQPILTYEKNGFVINAYDSKDYYNTEKVWIRMGGVVYNHNHKLVKYGTFKHQLIVDVPIGMLTIPPSRESLDVSANNDRVLKEIDDIILEIYENDKKSLTVPKFGEFVSGEKSGKTYESEWCKYNLFELFPDTEKLRRITSSNHKMYGDPIKPNANGKYIIYTFPEIRTVKSWIKRLEAVLTIDPDYSGCLAVFQTAKVMAELSKNTETLDVSDCIFVDVKSLGLPKLVTNPKDKDDGPTEYVIYKNGDKDYKTIDGLDEDNDSEIYKDAEWYKSEKLTRDQFLNRCIGWANTNDDRHGHGRDNRFWTTGAKKMYDGLVELGFIEINSKTYKDTMSLISSREQKQNDISQAQSRIKGVTFKIDVLQQVATAIGKNPSKLDRLKNIKAKILLEDSPRSRILKQIEDTYSYRTNLTRSDLRMILKMK